MKRSTLWLLGDAAFLLGFSALLVLGVPGWWAVFYMLVMYANGYLTGVRREMER